MSKKILILIPIGLLVVFGVMAILVTGGHANPDFSVEVADRYGFQQVTLNDGAIVQYIGDLSTTFGSAGSGVFESFVRMQGNNKKTADQRGYNTDGIREWDTKSGAFTHSILLSEIPTIIIDGNLYWEFFADINDSDSTPRISLDDFELYLTNNPNLTGYDFGTNAIEIYDFGDANPGEFILINDVNQGSGRGDMRYLVPQDGFEPGDCTYGNPACTTYLVLYSVWGGKGGDYMFDGGFEEWKVKRYPILQVSKDISGAYDTPVSWTITKDYDASYDLFTGESRDHLFEVSVAPILGAPENTMVSGTITIVGDDDDAVDAEVSDLFNGIPATITGCSVPVNTDGTYTVAAGATVTCAYELSLVGGPVDGTNVAMATYDLDEVSLAFQGSADILASAFVETLTGYPDIDVTDSNPDGGPWSTTNAQAATWTYESTFTCDADAGANVNTATITQTGQSDIATVTINCFGLGVSKTANTTFTRTHLWDITKSVVPANWKLFTGETGTSEYTVAVTKTGSSDSAFAVSGDITIVNTHPTRAAELTQVRDFISGYGEVAVDCSGATSVPALGSIVCTYSSDLSDAADRVNAAAATQQLYTFAANGDPSLGGTTDYNGTADILFDLENPSTEVDKEINVTDTNGPSWGPVSDSTSWKYEKTFACDRDAGFHQNIATITETGQDDSAGVTVSCYSLNVTKDAETSFTRTYFWTIDKVVDNPGPIQLNRGESVVVNYTITVNLDEPAYVDSGWAVAGDIVISNPHPNRAADLTALVDEISTGIFATVDCGGATSVPAADSLTCSYSSDLPDATTRTNTATATQQLYDFDKDKTPTADGTKDYQGSAAVDFSGATITEIDESVDVTDDYGTPGDTSDDIDFGSVHYSEVPAVFTYSRTITAGEAFCGRFQIDNTAELVTVDTSTILSDPASVVVDVACEGCTPGFWQGGAGSQLWDQVDDPQWTYGGSNPFIHTTLFNDFFNVTTDARLNGMTMYDLVSTGGTSNSAQRAARDMVAAYLNESAFPDTFPADSLADLLASWYAAVDGGDAALDSFHNEVGGWNDPPEGGYCPLP